MAGKIRRACERRSVRRLRDEARDTFDNAMEDFKFYMYAAVKICPKLGDPDPRPCWDFDSDFHVFYRKARELSNGAPCRVDTNLTLTREWDCMVGWTQRVRNVEPHQAKYRLDRLLSLFNEWQRLNHRYGQIRFAEA